METMPKVHHINHSQNCEFIQNHTNHINNNYSPQVSDSNNNFFKFCVHEEKSNYKNSKMITCASECNGKINHDFRKWEIYYDRFGNGHKMVFSQKVEI